MRVAVVTFPGSNCDYDIYKAIQFVGGEPSFHWHRGHELGDPDLVVLPGGFSYGDYLRAGAIARFSPIMEDVVTFARKGGVVLGVCNGFQILCEAGVLPGVLMRNQSLQFRCMPTHLVAASDNSPFTRDIEAGRVLAVPISHGEGNYYADTATLDMLEATGRVAFRYCNEAGHVTPEANPNGSLRNIAGILNEGRNVLGMMPHPERACDPLLGGEDGNAIWQSVLASVGVAA
jgi:phosphoribosylformylglycinamidine synthase